MALLKTSPAKEDALRIDYAARMTFTTTDLEQRAFEDLQPEFFFGQVSGLLQFFYPLYVDLNACYKGYGTMIYHLNYPHEDLTKPPSCTQVEIIMFLSRTLDPTERNYWLTDLEVFCLVWILCNICLIIHAAKYELLPIVYTDHVSITL